MKVIAVGSASGLRERSSPRSSNVPLSTPERSSRRPRQRVGSGARLWAGRRFPLGRRARSLTLPSRRRGGVAYAGACKALYTGSIPVVALSRPGAAGRVARSLAASQEGRMSRRARTTFTVAFALLALPAFAFGAVTDASALPPIKIAVEAPLTGSQSSNGLDMLRGVQLAVREANAGKGVLGRRVQIVRADDKGDRANAKRVARRVIRKNVAAVIGPYNSSVGIVNLPIYLRNRVVPVHLTSSDDTKGEGITIQPKNSQIAPVEEAYVRSDGRQEGHDAGRRHGQRRVHRRNGRPPAEAPGGRRHRRVPHLDQGAGRQGAARLLRRPRSRRRSPPSRICSTSARISPRVPRSPRRSPPPAPRPGA